MVANLAVDGLHHGMRPPRMKAVRDKLESVSGASASMQAASPIPKAPAAPHVLSAALQIPNPGRGWLFAVAGGSRSSAHVSGKMLHDDRDGIGLCQGEQRFIGSLRYRAVSSAKFVKMQEVDRIFETRRGEFQCHRRILLPKRQKIKLEAGSAGFSRRGLVLARTKPQRLKPALPQT